jgi:hypothetical protein
MAYAITNKAYPHPDMGSMPVAHAESADNVAAVASVDLGVAGLKHIRGRIRVKAFGADATGVSFVVKVSPAAAMTTPETVFVSNNNVATLSTAAGLNISFQGWSEAGYRYVSVTPTTTTGAVTYDFVLDGA